LVLLGGIEVEDRIVAARTGFHLNGDTLSVDRNDEIELAATNASVALEDQGPTRRKKVGCYLLA
jgi:hypothetical protein